jgi:CelD/BcsL family acetyltransferase involved in cellulose biosynthesis
MRVVTTPIEDPAWGEFASSHANANAFHLPAWAATIAECYRFEAFALTVRDTDDSIVAGVPVVAVRSALGKLRWISLPFSDHCPILVRTDSRLEDVHDQMAEHARASGAAEFSVRMALPATANSHLVDVGFLHVMDLPHDPSDLQPNRGHRGNVNRAIREGVQISRGTGEEDLAVFYELHTLTRRRHGVPVQPRRFFELIRTNLLCRGNGFIVTATLNDKPIATAMYLSNNRSLMKKYLASDPEHQAARAGHLVDWEVMIQACAEGFSTLDLGRSDPDAEGLRRYKSSWGAVETPLTYTQVSQHAPNADHSGVGELPKKIIRNSPTWVCQTIGELLYRYTA